MTNIEWTEKTWNPIVGCSIVSPGCTNCYAMKMAARLEAIRGSQPKNAPDTLRHYAGTTQDSKAGPVWTGKVAFAPSHILTEPLRRKKPTMWFVNSMSDLFHEDVPDEWIDQVFAVMALTPQHTYQVLTKRAARMLEYLAASRAAPVGLEALAMTLDEHARDARSGVGANVSLTGDIPHLKTWPLPNVWLGVSAERQKEADARISDLLATPAAVRFVSAEPLLGQIDFTQINPQKTEDGLDRLTDALRGTTSDWDPKRRGGWGGVAPASLDWIIVGGESGPGARPMHPDWARSIRDQCQQSRTAFFFKQWGEYHPTPAGHTTELQMTRCGQTAMPADLIGSKRAFKSPWRSDDGCVGCQRIGKSRAGRLLDGREWNEMPSATAPDAIITDPMGSDTNPHHGGKVSA